MPEIYIHQAVTFGHYETALTGEQRAALGVRLPRNALRRISDLGLLLGAALGELQVAPETPVLMGSTHGESCALAAYLGSYPTPSPTRFQTSVHPSSVQQTRVALQEPIHSYIPMAGEQGLAITLLRTALQLSSGEVVVIGGEEVCPTLSEQGSGSLTGFVFGLRLSSRAAGAIGRLGHSLDTCRNDPETGLRPLFNAIWQRTPLLLGLCDAGEVEIHWE